MPARRRSWINRVARVISANARNTFQPLLPCRVVASRLPSARRFLTSLPPRHHSTAGTFFTACRLPLLFRVPRLRCSRLTYQPVRVMSHHDHVGEKRRHGVTAREEQTLAEIRHETREPRHSSLTAALPRQLLSHYAMLAASSSSTPFTPRHRPSSPPGGFAIVHVRGYPPKSISKKK